MAPIRLYTDPSYGSLGTSRSLTITTAAAQVITVGSGYHRLTVVNLGPANVAYGDSSIAMGSGVILFPYSTEKWSPVVDGFQVYFRADSVATILQLHEYP